ncbi:MAG: glycosyltransferase [Desulfobaccales bacterium]
MSHIFHITDDITPISGVTGVITQLSRYLTGKGWTTTILAPEGQGNLLPADGTLITFPLAAGGVWRFPKGFTFYLQQHAQSRGQGFHLHGVWMGFQWLAARVASRTEVPALLSPHDMLNSWHFRQRGFKELRKLIYWRALAYPAFRHISVIHAVTPRERDELSPWFPGQRLEVIPNAIDLEEIARLRSSPPDDSPSLPDEPYLLFVGRLCPQKGIELLITAFAKVIQSTQRKFRLLIVGPDSDPPYSALLRSLVRLLKIEKQVSFLGPVVGAQKVSLYRHAWAFCAPSQTEAMGLVNLEAAALELPVVTTHETGLCGWEEGGGVLVHPQVEELSRALEQVFSWSESERQDRGQKLRQLVERRYSWQAVGPQWLELYAGLTGERRRHE